MSARAGNARAPAVQATPSPRAAPARPGPGWFLLQAGYAASTLRKYRAAVKRFVEWAIANEHEPADIDGLDAVLTEYFHDLYITNLGRGKQRARDTLYGLEMLLPRTKGQLRTAARCANRWAKSKPPQSYPPLTWELAVVIGVQMVRDGAYRMGVATVLAFCTLLRVGELMSLRKEHVRLPGDARLGLDHAATVLRFPKAKGGMNQSVEVREPAVVALLTGVVQRTKPGALLFHGGAPAYRSVFKATCAALGLSPLYVPHSLRHGGATRLKLQKQTLEDIMEHGRWASSRSARTYINAGRAKALAVGVPQALAHAAAALASDVTRAFELAQTH